MKEVIRKIVRKILLAFMLIGAACVAEAEQSRVEIDNNIAEMIQLCRDAALQGNALACLKLGELYFHGRGVEKDEKKAFEFFKVAALKGNGEAIKNLGAFYEFGFPGIIDQDITKAVQLYKSAAELGNIYAQNRLKVLGL
jgi:uncharacterized protein